MSADSIGKIADLLPCPFCGGPATFLADDSYETAHACCGPCEVGFISGSKTPEAAIAQWNRRALPSAELDAGRIAVFRICEHCNQEYQLTFGPTGISHFGPCGKCGQRDDPWIRVARANEAKR